MATTTTVKVVAPGAGESVTEGEILEWHVSEGDQIEQDSTIVEISTDKVDVEVPAPATGTVIKLYAAEGDVVQVGQLLAEIDVNGGPPHIAAQPDDVDEAPAAAPAASNGADTVAAAPEKPAGNATPVASRVAAAEGIDLAQVAGTGTGGKITKEDVLSAGTAPASAGTAPAAGQRTDLRGGAAMLAQYMDESLKIPTATSFRTLTVTTMDGRRQQLKDAGQKVSFTHLIAYAIARAAQDHMPVMAHHFDATGDKPARIDDGAVNLGIAVDVETKKGRTLMVPVIRDAGRKSFAEFKAAFDDLIARARGNELSADDLVGGNISLTNPGGIGTVSSVPRLMTGQGTIVATGSIAYPVGLGNVGAAIGAEKVMTMTSTYDHRVIQGAESGQFLKIVEEHLQGEHGFYEQVFESLGAPLGAAPLAPVPAAAATVPTVAPGTPSIE
ncbi:MAG TPA: 2-oxo acid dehydrogenase subunit E2, partial [Baekduia sp.]|nr:2-oxo acid dehydrogenase subunit E2 [Baekduia sp.]